MAVTSSSSSTSRSGSTLDVPGIVSQLMEVANQPITKLDSKISKSNVKISTLGMIKGSLSTLQAALTDLQTPANFSGMSAKFSADGVATATVSSSAVAGSYQMEVTQLARASITNVSGFTTSADALAWYNHASQAAVKSSADATVLMTSTGNYVLSLKAKATGTAAAFSVTLSAGDVAAGKTSSQYQTALDAQFKLNGVSFTRSSNTVTDALTGVTLNLAAASGTTTVGGVTTTIPVTMTVANAASAARPKLDAFVKAYNDLNTLYKEQTAASMDASTRGVLNSDFAVGSMMRQLVTGLMKPLTNASGADLTTAVSATLYNATTDFVSGTGDHTGAQSTSNTWQYFAGTSSAVSLLSDYQTTGNFVIPGSPQWDGNMTAGDCPFVQKTNINGVPSLVLHPDDSSTGVAVGWKNTSASTVNVTLSASLALAYPSQNSDGLSFYVQRELTGSARYQAIQSGTIAANSTSTLTIEPADSIEVAPGELIYIGLGRNSSYVYDHTVLSMNVTATPAVAPTATDTDLSALGLKLLSTGELAVDDTLLAAATTLDTRLAAGISIGFDSSSGNDLTEQITAMLASGGVLQDRIESEQKVQTELNTRKTTLQDKLVSVQARYTAQYAALDALLFKLTSTSDSLKSALDGLTASQKNN